MTARRCGLCLTKFKAEDFIPHMQAHTALVVIPKQKASELAYFLANAPIVRHAPGEGCTCPYYGLRAECETRHRGEL